MLFNSYTFWGSISVFLSYCFSSTDWFNGLMTWTLFKSVPCPNVLLDVFLLLTKFEFEFELLELLSCLLNMPNVGFFSIALTLLKLLFFDDKEFDFYDNYAFSAGYCGILSSGSFFMFGTSFLGPYFFVSTKSGVFWSITTFL